MIETGSLSPTESRILLSHIHDELITSPCLTARIPFFRYSPEKMIPHSQSTGEEKSPESLAGGLSDPYYPITCSIEICMAIEHGADRSLLAEGPGKLSRPHKISGQEVTYLRRKK